MLKFKKEQSSSSIEFIAEEIEWMVFIAVDHWLDAPWFVELFKILDKLGLDVDKQALLVRRNHIIFLDGVTHEEWWLSIKWLTNSK